MNFLLDLSSEYLNIIKFVLIRKARNTRNDYEHYELYEDYIFLILIEFFVAYFLFFLKTVFNKYSVISFLFIGASSMRSSISNDFMCGSNIEKSMSFSFSGKVIINSYASFAVTFYSTFFKIFLTVPSLIPNSFPISTLESPLVFNSITF